MTIQELITEENKRHEASLKTIDEISSLNVEVTHINEKTVFLKDATYEENMKTLHQLRSELLLTLKMYYPAQNMLCLHYAGDDIDINMYCTDMENAVEKVGNGKCRLVTETKEELEMVCDA